MQAPIDPTWLGLILSALSLIVAIITIFVPVIQQRKSITWDYGWWGNEIYLSVWNNGNTTILSSEYLEPISFHISRGSKPITEVSVIGTQPKGISPHLSWDEDSVVIEPITLNNYDAIKLKIIVNSNTFPGRITANTRIAGVKEFKIVSRRALAYSLLVFLASCWIFTILLAFKITSIAIFQIILGIVLFLGLGLAQVYIYIDTALPLNGNVRSSTFYFMTYLKFYLVSLLIGLIPFFVYQIILHLLQHK